MNANDEKCSSAIAAGGFGFAGIWRPYRYVLYFLLSRMESRHVALPIFRALAAMALLVLLNVGCLVFAATYLVGNPFNHLAMSRLEAFPLLAAYFLFFYKIAVTAWISNGRLTLLRREFESMSPAREHVLRAAFWVYAAFTAVSLPLTGLVLRAMR